jgi:hypothetical protein
LISNEVSDECGRLKDELRVVRAESGERDTAEARGDLRGADKQ